MASVSGRTVRGGRKELNSRGQGKEKDVVEGRVEITRRMGNFRVQTSGVGQFLVITRSQPCPLAKEEPRSKH